MSIGFQKSGEDSAQHKPYQCCFQGSLTSATRDISKLVLILISASCARRLWETAAIDEEAAVAAAAEYVVRRDAPAGNTNRGYFLYYKQVDHSLSKPNESVLVQEPVIL